MTGTPTANVRTSNSPLSAPPTRTVAVMPPNPNNACHPRRNPTASGPYDRTRGVGSRPRFVSLPILLHAPFCHWTSRFSERMHLLPLRVSAGASIPTARDHRVPLPLWVPVSPRWCSGSSSSAIIAPRRAFVSSIGPLPGRANLYIASDVRQICMSRGSPVAIRTDLA